MRAALALLLVGCIPPHVCGSGEGDYDAELSGPTCLMQPDSSCHARFGYDADMHLCSAEVVVTCSFGEARGLVEFTADGAQASGEVRFPDGCVYEVRITRGETP